MSARCHATDLMEGLRDIVASVLDEQGVQDAGTLADVVMHRLSREYGGQSIYVPRDTLRRIDVRNQEIFDRFDGRNHADLARDYGISVQHVYRIIKRHYVSSAQQRRN